MSLIHKRRIGSPLCSNTSWQLFFLQLPDFSPILGYLPSLFQHSLTCLPFEASLKILTAEKDLLTLLQVKEIWSPDSYSGSLFYLNLTFRQENGMNISSRPVYSNFLFLHEKLHFSTSFSQKLLFFDADSIHISLKITPLVVTICFQEFSNCI